MAFIGSPGPGYTIRGIRKDTSYIIKFSAVYYMRYLLHMPMGAVIISMLYVINLFILHYALHKSVLHWKVCYIYFLPKGDSSTATELYIHLY